MKQKDLKKQLEALQRNKRLLWLAILSFVIVIFWILLGLLSSQKKVTITAKQKELATALVPRLESNVFSEIAAARYFPEEEIMDFPIYVFVEGRDKTKLESYDIVHPDSSVNPEEIVIEEQSLPPEESSPESATSVIDSPTQGVEEDSGAAIVPEATGPAELTP